MRRILNRLKTVHAALLAAVISCAAVGLAPTAAVAAPEPSPVPERWQLTLVPGPLRITTMTVDGAPRAFFYMPYKVVNKTGQDLYFAPMLELATDEGDIVRSGRNVPMSVTQSIIERLGNPYIVDQISAIGTLRQGEERAIESVAIWPADDLTVDQVTVYAAGFSGETHRVVKPYIDENGEEQTREVVLRKTLMLVHSTPGDLVRRGSAPLDRVEQRWIMR